MNAELIARLEAANVGDLDLSADVIEATGTPVPRDVPITWLEGHECAPVTTSLDAALEMAERVLPLGSWALKSAPNQDCLATLYFTDYKFVSRCKTAYGRTSPLALCIAILRALDQGEEK